MNSKGDRDGDPPRADDHTDGRRLNAVRVSFVKCHGSGNDFALVDQAKSGIDDADWPMVARALADRGGPVGSDGLLLLTPGDADHAFGMRMFNPDGSEAETCLNGLRCVARAGFEAIGLDTARVRLKTSSADVVRDPPLAPGVVTIGERVGPADLEVGRWPMMVGSERVVDTPIAPLGGGRRFTAVAIPNPHLIAFVDVVDAAAEAELVALGRRCEAAPHWLPNRANLSFVARRGDTLFVRTFERGAGLTDSCGSAMAASLYAACLTGRAAFDVDVTILNRGGLVRARADREAMIRIAGNATFLHRGVAEIERDVVRRLDVDRGDENEERAWAAAVGAIGSAA